jgi:hypothetical protein
VVRRLASGRSRVDGEEEEADDAPRLSPLSQAGLLPTLAAALLLSPGLFGQQPGHDAREIAPTRASRRRTPRPRDGAPSRRRPV